MKLTSGWEKTFFFYICIPVYIYIYVYVYVYVYIPGLPKARLNLAVTLTAGRYLKTIKGHIYIYNGYVDLRHLGIYVDIRGNPPSPTDTPQPQQQQLLINQFQVYKCQDCLKWVFEGHFTGFFMVVSRTFHGPDFVGNFR